MDLFAEGQKIAIYFEKNSNVVEMTCVIENVHNDRLSLTLPQYFMRYINLLQVGNIVSAKAFSKLGTIDFNSVIISSPLEEVFEIELDYNSLRFTEKEDIPVIGAIENVEIKTADEQVYRAKTYEISTNFLRFYSNEQFIVGTSCGVTVFLPKKYGILKLNGTISEVDPIYENEYTVKFYYISDTDRQSLLYYMYMYSTNSEQV
ncbi:MAG: hypothetical protein MJ230_01875 [bacterium]|nr:hypothetical protein [bacterium]